MKIMLTAASLRKDSFNKKLIKIANEIVTKNQQQGHIHDFSEYDMPLYNGDIEKNLGFPAGSQLFVDHLNATDALILASPEYNFSVPGILKNLIDWISRIDQPLSAWNNRQILLLSASPALAGGVRGLWHLRVPLEGCGAFVYPRMFSLSMAHTAFDDNDQLKDQNLQQQLEKSIKEFIAHVEHAKKR